MRVEENHAHARTRYKPIGIVDYVNLYQDVTDTKKHRYLSLNVHLPFEIQHFKNYSFMRRLIGKLFIQYGEMLKQIYKIPLYWENAPELIYGEWSLKQGQTDWSHIPGTIDITLDTGHLMLNATSEEDARERIRSILLQRGAQIKHLHIHENNLIHDKHWHTDVIITPELKANLFKGRTYIYEKGE